MSSARASIDVGIGDGVFGSAAGGGGVVELVVSPTMRRSRRRSISRGAAALPVAVETAVRTLDLLGVADGHDACSSTARLGSVGSAAVQFARARGARVIGTASRANQDYLRSLGAEPTTYGDGLVERVRALAPDGVDARARCRRRRGAAGRWWTLDQRPGARGDDRRLRRGRRPTGVRLQRRHGGPSALVHALGDVGALIAAGRFSVPVAQTFPLDADRRGTPGHRDRAPGGQARTDRRMSSTSSPGARSSRRCRSPTPPERWEALGFTVTRRGSWRWGASSSGWMPRGGGSPAGRCAGRRSWRRHRRAGDGVTHDPAPVAAPHPNGAIGLDHVVVVTPDFERTRRRSAPRRDAAAADSRGDGELASGLSPARPGDPGARRGRDAPPGAGAVLGPGGDRRGPRRPQRPSRPARLGDPRRGPARPPDRDARARPRDSTPRVAFMDPE